MDHVPIPVALLDDLGAALSLADVLQAFSPWLRRSVDAERTSIALLTDTGTDLDIWAVAGGEAIRVGTTLPLEQSLPGQALSDQRVIVTNDLAKVSTVEAPKLLAAGLRSTLNIPFESAGRAVGVVNFGHSQPGYFAEQDRDRVHGLMKLLGSHVAVHEHVVRQQRLAATDELTGVLGRRAILRRLDEILAQSDGTDAAVLYVDLDGFKQINDMYGHAAGDAVLKEIAQRFERTLRSADIIGRLGGDEFLVVLEPGTSESALMGLAQGLFDVASDPIDLGLNEVSIHSSIGAAMTSRRSMTATEMLVEADLAMYHAKGVSTSIVMADAAISRQAERLAAIDRDVESAMQSGDMVFHYQLIRGLADLEVLGIEALVRWFHPDHGLIPPPLLIERIEALGLVQSFTEWTLRTAATDLLLLREQAPVFWDKSTSINLTPRQLAWAGYADAHTAMLHAHNLRPIDIIVEVVESGLVEVGDAAENTLRTLSERGTHIALDDFGTGHNVLGYFAQFPVGAIKFDRSLIESMTTSERVRSLIRGLSQVAHELGIYTLAEGIERQEQIDLSLELGIVKGQGYLLGMPMSLDELAREINEEFDSDRLHREHPVSR